MSDLYGGLQPNLVNVQIAGTYNNLSQGASEKQKDPENAKKDSGARDRYRTLPPGQDIPNYPTHKENGQDYKWCREFSEPLQGALGEA
jgi:hypothetical protein